RIPEKPRRISSTGAATTGSATEPAATTAGGSQNSTEIAGFSTGGAPGAVPNAPAANRQEQGTVRTEPATGVKRMIRCQPPPYHSAVYSDSLATKPNSGGTAAMEAAEISPITVTTGATFHTPDSTRRSRVPNFLSMTPTTMNSGALNKEWAISIASPASSASWVASPATADRNPSWETVP